ncbi:GAP1-N2 domain-containing protein [Microlunatus soli]|uniref:Uncharacterized protein n=1 Tax=Microlunatus soli TaxID=630515 RepID=A0A1H1UW28_9ACTN|nr:hypothetical protein [Microlunatus soli]SDS76316.1 hypothetical protein SAMN04489812_2945 [Microlunatus soli]
MTAVQPGVGSTTPSDRYAELTYSSFDDGVSGGGWQVKQVRGRLSDPERDALRAQLSTYLDTGVELPRFPTPEQIAGFPRRLVYAPASGFAAGGPAADGSAVGRPAAGACAWWHTAPAGVDASGRPGNVFSQVVLDRRPSTPPVFRPIDLWRSPSWLTPYGPEQVAAAELAPGLPGPGTGVDLDALIDFCFADFDKIAVLGPLLDACAAAVVGGPPVILGVLNPERSAQWIAAVSRLTAPLISRTIYFSTLERAPGLAEALQRGLRLICIPSADVAEVDHARRSLGTPTVLLVEDEFPELGDLGGPDESAHPHRTGHGDRIAVTAWSVLARVVLEAESPDQARTVLARIDPIVEQVAAVTGTGRSPGYSADWPLAMAVAEAGELFVEAQPEAARVIGRNSPADLEQLPDLYRPAAAVIATQCGTTTRDAWRQWRSTVVGSAVRSSADHDPVHDHGAVHDHGSGADRDQDNGYPIGSVLIFDSYLRRAIVDDDWLIRADGVPLPEPPPSVDRDRLAGLVDQRLRELLDLPSPDPLLVARLADLLVRTGLADDPTTARLSHLADVALTPRLTGAGAAELVGRIGPLAEQTLERVIRPGLVIEPPAASALGRTLSPIVLDWLYPRAPAAVRLRTVYDAERTGALPGDYWLRAERDWSSYARGGVEALGEQEIGYAVWTMLEAAERTAPLNAWRQPVVDWTPCLPLLRRPVDPDDLSGLVHRFEPGRSTATEITAATLLTVPWSDHRWSDDVRRLCRRLQQGDRRDLHPAADADLLPQVREWLAERTWATAWWSTSTATVVNAIRSWSTRPGFPAVADYAADVRRGVAAVLMVELIFGREADKLATLLGQFGPDQVPVDQELVDQLAAVINSGEKQRRDPRSQRPPALVAMPQAMAAVLRSDPAPLSGRLATDGGRWLSAFTVRGVPVLEALLGNWLAKITDKDRIRQLRDDTVQVLTRTLSAADNTRDLDRAVMNKIRKLRTTP